MPNPDYEHIKVGASVDPPIIVPRSSIFISAFHVRLQSSRHRGGVLLGSNVRFWHLADTMSGSLKVRFQE